LVVASSHVCQLDGVLKSDVPTRVRRGEETTLHWIENDGPVNSGMLMLLDMGVENRNLNTADITRTLRLAVSSPRASASSTSSS
jgi:hypothetical protein